MLNSKLLILFLFLGCATTEKTSSVAHPASKDDTEVLKLKCEDQNDALACARFGYLKKDTSYTRRACVLHNEQACFNLREIEQRAPNQNFALISSNQGQIYSCYVNHSIDVDNGEGLPEDKEVKLVFSIGPDGKISNLSVIGKKLSQKFKACVVNSFSAKKFTAMDYEQSLSYSFSMPALKRDKRIPQKSKPGILD